MVLNQLYCESYYSEKFMLNKSKIILLFYLKLSTGFLPPQNKILWPCCAYRFFTTCLHSFFCLQLVLLSKWWPPG